MTESKEPQPDDPLSYDDFVQQEIKSWTDKGVKWKFPQNKNEDDNKESQGLSKYTSDVVDGFITTVYKTITTKSSEFVRLLLLFTHQTVIGRIFASYSQIPEYLRNIHIKNKEFTTMSLLQWQWNEQQNKSSIPVNFRRVYLIFLTNYLNRVWQYYHIDLEKEPLDTDSEEYIHIKSIQEALDAVFDSTQTSTKNQTKLPKSIVFEKITENCCSLTGTMLDSLLFRYRPIIIGNLQELFNVLSLISLKINQLFRTVEEKWLNNVDNYKKDRFKDKTGDDNFVTLVLSKEEQTDKNKGNQSKE